MSLSCGLVHLRAVLCPGAAPEPAGGIQTPGTDGPPSPAAAYVAVPATSPPHWLSELTLRLRALSPQRRPPGRGRGLGSDLGWDDVIGPLKGGVLVGQVWDLEGRALWFYLW